MHLRPSEILFSQDSINCVFDSGSSHSGEAIGKTLDKLCSGRCSILDIPPISVMKRDDRWVTADNRRLWVFRHLERLGKCVTIPVVVITSIPADKLTSTNNGESVRVRGNPRGMWHLRDSDFDSDDDAEEDESEVEDNDDESDESFYKDDKYYDNNDDSCYGMLYDYESDNDCYLRKYDDYDDWYLR